jgi:hypothetical protein
MIRTSYAALLLTIVGCSPSLPAPLPEEVPLATEEDASEPTASAAPSRSVAPPQTPAQKTPAQTAAKPGFTLPPDLDVGAVGGDDDQLFLVLDSHDVADGKVARIKRSGEQLVHRGPGGRDARMRTVAVGNDRAAVATGQMGAVAIYRKSAWDYRLAPALEGERIGAVAIAKDGTVYAAGEQHALYVRKGDSWTTHRYGALTSPMIVEALVDAGGKVTLIGGQGHVLTFSGGAFTKVSIAGLSAGSLSRAFSSTWVDAKRRTVWAASDKSLIAIDLAAKKATHHKSSLFFEIKDISGTETGKGPLLIAGTFGRIALFDGKDWYFVAKQNGERLWLDGKKAQVYVADPFDFKVFDVHHPWLGTGSSPKLK